MKTRFLIIIGIIIVLGTAGITIAEIYQGQIEWKEKVGGLRDSDHQLQLVLDYCDDSNPKDSYGLSYYNETHYINNDICEWQKIGNYPNSDRLCIPHSSQSYTDGEIRNDTHIYNKQTCQWEIEFSWYDEYTRSTIDNIRIHGNNDNGSTPSLLKYCLSGGTSDGFTINNSTHYFDFETCKWKNHPLKIQVCRGDCDDSSPLEFDQTIPVVITVCENGNDVPCIDLVDIVFGGIDWPVYPGGVGPVPPENFTLTKIYKDSGFGMPTIDFEAMLDDKTFVNKCESNGGVWNYTYHDCEGIWEICQDVSGVKITRDTTKPCTGVCLDRKVYRMSCVFEYEN